MGLELSQVSYTHYTYVGAHMRKGAYMPLCVSSTVIYSALELAQYRLY